MHFYFQQIQGSGPSGEVRASDVENFQPGAAAAMPTAATIPAMPSMAAMPAPGASFTDIPLTNIRQVRHNEKDTAQTCNSCTSQPDVCQCLGVQTSMSKKLCLAHQWST